MICALCLLEKEPKSNTHYITDFLIRTALNEDGVNIKNKGLYWTFPLDNPFIQFSYQQASVDKIEEVLGRIPTDEENEVAKSNTDFSVDDKFCKDCEDKFGLIESAFADKLLKQKFRNTNLSGRSETVLNEKESQLFRLFFLLQIWRTNICEPEFNIDQAISEELRLKILNNNSSDLEKFPLSVTYLETLKDPDDVSKGDGYKTQNIVGIAEGENPHILLLNDFVVSYYKGEPFPFESLRGFFDNQNYINLLNIGERDFKIKIISDANRRKILNNFFKGQTGRLEEFKKIFVGAFAAHYFRKPTLQIFYAFWNEFADNENMNKYTQDGFHVLLKDFFEKVDKVNNITRN